jgi:hypothetical protein
VAAIPVQRAAAAQSGRLPRSQNRRPGNGPVGPESSQYQRQGRHSDQRSARRPRELHVRSSMARNRRRWMDSGTPAQSWFMGIPNDKGHSGLSGFRDGTAQSGWIFVYQLRSHPTRRQSGPKRLGDRESNCKPRIWTHAVLVLLLCRLPVGTSLVGGCKSSLAS